MKRWLRNFLIRQLIYLVDWLEASCFEWQTELRKRLTEGDHVRSSKQTLRSPSAPRVISDFRLGWRIVQALFWFVGVVAVAAFFNTLDRFYLCLFTVACAIGFALLFLAIRGIYHKTLPADPGVSASVTEQNAEDEPATPAQNAAGERPLRRRKVSLSAAEFDARLRRRRNAYTADPMQLRYEETGKY